MSDDRTLPTPPDLETLMAYADGELLPDEAVKVEQWLATDAAAQTQVAALRRSAALARQAFDADLAQPVPPALGGAVEQAITRARRHARSAPASPAARTDWRVGRRLAALGFGLRPAGAFAASAALALVGVVAYQLGKSTGDLPAVGVQLVSAGERPALDAALASARSADRLMLPSGARIELIASFTSGGGALCREFKLQRPAADALAVACRDGEAWQVSFASLAPAAGGYAPAASSSAAIDAYLASIGAVPLTAEQEAARLR